MSRFGIIFDEPAEVYYRRVLGEANNSALTIIDERSPAHYLHWVSNPADDEFTEALEFGKAFHMATLEPERFGDTYCVLPANAPRDMRRFRDAKKPSKETLESIDWWDTWDSCNAGRVTLSRSAYDLAAAMGASLRAYRMDLGGIEVLCGELFDACRKEVTIRWIDPETGLPCKARLDLFEEELAFGGDLKSCLCASPETFARAINAHRYHVQHAHYCAGAAECGSPLRSFALFPVEKRAPHVPASYHIDPPSEERGYAIRARSLRKLKRCMESGQWPGYTTTVTSIGIPAYGHYDTKE